MTCNFARSKPVHDMYELANIASIVYGSNWGPHARERELLKDDSKCLNTVGLSLAMAAHKRNCFKYARAIAMAQGQAFTHSAIFDSHPGFDLDAYFMQALARCEKIVLSDIEESPLTPTLIVLPHSFRNVAKEIKVEDQVDIYAYKNFYDLARVLTERPITASIIMVWPLERPTNDAARKVVLQLERHLRCGGTLQMFPSPYEDAKSELWEERRNTVSAVVEYLQGPERGWSWTSTLQCATVVVTPIPLAAWEQTLVKETSLSRVGRYTRSSRRSVLRSRTFCCCRRFNSGKSHCTAKKQRMPLVRTSRRKWNSRRCPTLTTAASRKISTRMESPRRSARSSTSRQGCRL
ncbi:hypothetical protein Aduo_005420 [Ancylostoma duodenale]